MTRALATAVTVALRDTGTNVCYIWWGMGEEQKSYPASVSSSRVILGQPMSPALAGIQAG